MNTLPYNCQCVCLMDYLALPETSRDWGDDSVGIVPAPQGMRAWAWSSKTYIKCRACWYTITSALEAYTKKEANWPANLVESMNIWFNEKPCLKTKGGEWSRKDTRQHLASICTHMCSYKVLTSTYNTHTQKRKKTTTYQTIFQFQWVVCKAILSKSHRPATPISLHSSSFSSFSLSVSAILISVQWFVLAVLTSTSPLASWASIRGLLY